MNYKDCIPPTIDEAVLNNEDIKQFVRAWRTNQLNSSDWTQLSDVTIDNKVEWTVYRQELRDMPSQGDDPKTWVFPVPPI